MQLADLYSGAVLSDARVSPDGGQVAWVVTTVDRKLNRRVPAIWVADSGGRQAPRMVAGAGASNPRWSPDGTRLGFVATRGGAPLAQVYQLRLEGGEAQRIGDLPDGVAAFEWSPDGGRLVCVSRVPAPAASHRFAAISERLLQTEWRGLRRRAPRASLHRGGEERAAPPAYGGGGARRSGAAVVARWPCNCVHRPAPGSGPDAQFRHMDGSGGGRGRARGVCLPWAHRAPALVA